MSSIYGTSCHKPLQHGLLAVSFFYAFSLQSIYANPLHIPFKPSSNYLSINTSLTQPTTAPQANVSLTARPTIQCNAAYGQDPDLADCRAAINHLGSWRNRLTFRDRYHMPRHVPEDEMTVPLPYRALGRKSPYWIFVDWGG